MEPIPGSTAEVGKSTGASSPAAAASFATPPTITPPKGGGAVRGLDEKLNVNPANGTASYTLELPASPGREGSGPRLSLSYDSGAGNGPFGLGWSLSLPSVTRRTDRGLPRYRDDIDSDLFVLSGSEELVPVRDSADGWGSRIEPPHAPGHRVDRYRPRVEGTFARIERWTRLRDGDTHWRSISRDNVTTIYGLNADSRVYDPADPTHVFTWLIALNYDDRGNVTRYDYKPENDVGVDLNAAHERDRDQAARTVQRYLKSIRYGNQVSRLVDPELNDDHYLFQVVLDYGEHDPDAPSSGDTGPWLCRRDAFSSHRAGFEARTYRLCQRVLLFHHFPHVAAVGADCLVKSVDLTYRGDSARGEPVASFLIAATARGHRRDAAGRTSLALPPVEFDYSVATPTDEVRLVDAASLESLPAGVDRSGGHHWLDLDGEGVAGVVTELADAWLYRRGLGGARYAPATVVAALPTVARGDHQFLDLAGDGTIDVVSIGGDMPGFAERDGAGWAPFTPLSARPAAADDRWQRVADLTGDGLADILRTDVDGFVWHASLGRAGWAAGERVVHPLDERDGPRLVFADADDSVYLADMSGDGLADLVRIRNGEVNYWPNQGYGRFGRRVTMDSAPRFADPDAFDQRRLRLADVDGSGPTDLVYLGADGVRIWANQAGNGFAPARTVSSLPTVDDPASVTVTDLLGAGTACVVWSSPLPGDAAAPMRYVELTGGGKPHLLTRVRNNLGAESVVEYAPSTRFSLADRAAGREWLTRLPFPVHVVERILTYDLIGMDRFVSRYAYHHGNYDGIEREFRGFGMVERWDTEEYATFAAAPGFATAANLDAASHAPPVLTRIWYHTGDRRTVRELFPAELPGDVIEPAPGRAVADLSADELREAWRALKGSALREEIFADDGSADAGQPYAVVERSFAVRELQPRDRGRHGVYLVHPREQLDLCYERATYDRAGKRVRDPRVGHTVILDVDRFGAVRRAAMIGYGRRYPDPDPLLTDWDRARQGDTLMTLVENDVTNPVLAGVPDRLGGPVEDAYRVPLPSETRGYEVTHPSLTAARRLDFDEVRALADGQGTRRLRHQKRTFYRADDLSTDLPLGVVQARALPAVVETLVYTPELLGILYGNRVDGAMLTEAGCFRGSDQNWWLPSGVVFYVPRPAPPMDELNEARAHFFRPRRFVDAFGTQTTVEYDEYDLLARSIIDPAGNSVSTVNDYRVLAPALTTDPNDNRSACAFDEWGNLVAFVAMGKEGETDPDRMGDTLADPTVRLVYDLDAWRTRGEPTSTRILRRELHRSTATRWQEAVAYVDGLGRPLQSKQLVEPGPAIPGGPMLDPRWLATGAVVYNNKGKVVRRYEPFFSATDAMDRTPHGVSETILYDALGRVAATVHPDHTLTKTVLDPWRQEEWDGNDLADLADPALDPDVGPLVARLAPADYLPTWSAQRRNGGVPDVERDAAVATHAHARTPRLSYLDALGRPFLVVSTDGLGRSYAVRTTLDIEGRPLAVTDPRGVRVIANAYDLIGRLAYTSSVDAGRRWRLPEASGVAIRTWGERGQVIATVFDAARRPVELRVDDGGGGRVFSRTVYGEAQGVAGNHRGRIYQVYDESGRVTSAEYDFKGNLLTSVHQLRVGFLDDVDWAADPPLSDVEYTTVTAYDALDRPTLVHHGDGSTITSGYDLAGQLNRLDVSMPAAPAGFAAVSAIGYNAKGQRETMTLAGGVLESRARFDPLTFRVTGLTTTRTTDGRRLRDLTYTYDPVGNTTAVGDAAQATVFYDNQMVSADRRYTYDALYQLTRATGREHDGSGAAARSPLYDADDAARRGRTHPNDASALRRYAQTYDYDPAGNIVAVTHTAGGAGWTRRYDYPSTDNRLRATNLPGDAPDVFSATYSYDAHGNLSAMPHLPEMAWDHNDRLVMTRAQVASGGETERTHYVYDGGGQRRRKVTVRANGTVRSERVYLPGHEIYREYAGTGEIALERRTLTVVAGQERVAMVETLTVDNRLPVASPVPVIRYQIGDQLDSSVLEVDGAGEIITYEEYHPYGTTAYQAGRSLAEVSLKRYRFTGRERDSETGFTFHGARYYIPWLGRWTRPDPAGLRDGTNLYRYVRNNPVGLVDPSGLGSALPPSTQRAAKQAPHLDQKAVEGVGARVHREVTVKSGADGSRIDVWVEFNDAAGNATERFTVESKSLNGARYKDGTDLDEAKIKARIRGYLDQISKHQDAMAEGKHINPRTGKPVEETASFTVRNMDPTQYAEFKRIARDTVRGYNATHGTSIGLWIRMPKVMTPADPLDSILPHPVTAESGIYIEVYPMVEDTGPWSLPHPITADSSPHQETLPITATPGPIVMPHPVTAEPGLLELVAKAGNDLVNDAADRWKNFTRPRPQHCTELRCWREGDMDPFGSEIVGPVVDSPMVLPEGTTAPAPASPPAKMPPLRLPLRLVPVP